MSLALCLCMLALGKHGEGAYYAGSVHFRTVGLHFGFPEQAIEGFPLSLGLVVLLFM